MIEECKVENKQPPNNSVEWQKVKIKIKKVNHAIQNIETKNLTDLNYLLRS